MYFSIVEHIKVITLTLSARFVVSYIYFKIKAMQMVDAANIAYLAK